MCAYDSECQRDASNMRVWNLVVERHVTRADQRALILGDMGKGGSKQQAKQQYKLSRQGRKDQAYRHPLPCTPTRPPKGVVEMGTMGKRERQGQGTRNFHPFHQVGAKLAPATEERGPLVSERFCAFFFS